MISVACAWSRPSPRLVDQTIANNSYSSQKIPRSGANFPEADNLRIGSRSLQDGQDENLFNEDVYNTPYFHTAINFTHSTPGKHVYYNRGCDITWHWQPP